MNVNLTKQYRPLDGGEYLCAAHFAASVLRISFTVLSLLQLGYLKI